MKTNTYFIILLILFLSSCNEEINNKVKEEDPNKITSIEDYFDFLNTDTDGRILIQSIETPLSSNNFSISSDIKGNTEPLSLKVDDRNISFKNYKYNKLSNKSSSDINSANLSDVFGSHFSVHINSKNMIASRSANEISTQVESVYIPKLIHTAFSNLKDDKVSEGTKISWNLDDNNGNGVIVGLEYNPFIQVDENVVLEKPERLLKGLTLPDKGTYTITKEDLADFPTNSTLTFYIGRVGYNIAIDKKTGKDYSLGAITLSTTDLEIIK